MGPGFDENQQRDSLNTAEEPFLWTWSSMALTIGCYMPNLMTKGSLKNLIMTGTLKNK